MNSAIDYHRKYHKNDLHPTATEHISAKESNQGWDNLLYENVFVLGKEKGLNLINQLNGIACLIITDEDELLQSNDMQLDYY